MILLCVLINTNAYAMRCGNQLVYEGDSEYTVLSKCGEPLDKLSYEENIPLFNEAGYQIGVTTRIVVKWIYQKSSAEFQYEVIFNDGVVKEINANRNP